MRRIKIPVGVKVFVAIWLLALCVPSVRELPKAFAFYGLRGNATPTGDSEGAATDLVHRFPNNVTALGWRAEQAYRDGNVDELKAVATRFPGNLEIRSLQVRIFGDSNTSVEATRAKADKTARARWIEAAQTARTGAEAEPDNAFWPWMEAAFEFGAHRDKAAFAAFERAGRCTRYEDYVLPTSRARVALWKSASFPGWGRQTAVSPGTYFLYFGAMRNAAIVAGKRVHVLRAWGENARALSVEAGLLNATRVMRRDGKTVATALTAENAAQLSLEELFGIAHPKGPSSNTAMQAKFVEPAVHKARLASAWANFARQNERPQLAGRADFLMDASIQDIFQQSYDKLGFLAYETGLSETWLPIALASPFVMVLLALCIAAGAIVWGASARLPFEGDAPTRGQIAACSNFSFWLAVGLTVLFGVCNVQTIYNLSWNALSRSSSNILLGLIALVTSCWLLPIGAFCWLRRRQERTKMVPTQSKAPFGIRNPLVSFLWLVTLCFGLGFFSSVTRSGSNYVCEIFGVLAVFAALGALTASWRVTRRQFGWQMARRSAGVLALMGSALFLGTALVSWPLDARLNYHAERTLEVGEIAATREQMARFK